MRLRTGLGLRRRAHRLREYFTKNARYDRETHAVMRRVLKPDSCCIDVGAHKGMILQWMVDLAPHGRHLAFEALPHLADALRQRFPTITVTVRGEAASHQAGQADFIHILNAPGYSGLHTQKTYERTDLQFTTITVPTVRIDDCIDDDRAIAFIKLDIEGGEFHALQGAERLLLRDHPILVFECCGPTTMDPYGVTIPDMATWLMAHGYKLSSMRNWLSRRGPVTIEEMCTGPDYYFMAYP